jgi:hypothetical protein
MDVIFGSVRSVVKNTFILFEVDAEVPVISRERLRRNSDISDARDQDSRTCKAHIESLFLAIARDCNVSDRDSEHFQVKGDCSLRRISECSRLSETCSSQPSEAIGDCAEVAEIVAQESVGSANHIDGLCKPCVWFWRSVSCQKGSLCDYCHLCDKDAVKRSVSQRQMIKNMRRKAIKAMGERSKIFRERQRLELVEQKLV